MKKLPIEIVRGNRWTYGVTLRMKNDPTFDFTGATVTLPFRRYRTKDKTAPALLTLNPVPTFAPGSVSFAVDLSAAQVEILPDTCAADLLIARATGEPFGPITPIGFDLTILPTT
jgi:hypothetical protein